MRSQASTRVTRRVALQTGGSFLLAFPLLGHARRAWAEASPRPQSGDAAAADGDGKPPFAPNAFIRIDRTGPIRLVIPNVEMGQGIYTGEATLLAEEMDVDLDQVQLEHAPPNPALYAMPAFHTQETGGSTSTRGAWRILREAGAVARNMLIEAAATKWAVDPSLCIVNRGVVQHIQSGRSATYGTLAEAAARQPIPLTVKLKDPSQFRLIGKALRRLDTSAKVSGNTIFGIDARVQGMMIATVVTCPTYGGRLKSFDDAEARKIPGVKDVVILEDAIAVTAVHYWAAKCGVDALEIEWDLGSHANFSSLDIEREMELRSMTGVSLIARQVGSLDQTGTRIEAIYRLPPLAHATMEPLNATVHVTEKACEIWVGTQVPVRVVNVAAKITGLPVENIIVHNHYLGGGFGRRLETDSIEQAVEIAKQVPYPVKLIWTREQDIQHDIPRPPYFDRIAAVVDEAGYPVLWTDKVTGASVSRRWAPNFLRADGFDPDTTEGADHPPYDLENIKVEWTAYDMPGGMPVGWWRGVGSTHNLFKVESFIDELAFAAHIDPLSYRRALLRQNPRALNVLNLAVDEFGWHSPVDPRVGRGIALGTPFGSFICAIVEVAVTSQGEIQLLRATVAVDCGIVVNPNTVEAQIQGGMIFGWTGALYSKLSYVNGAVVESNFNDYRMMRIDETPPISVHLTRSLEPPGGIGELGTTVAAPALANAIFAATGVRIRRLPFDRTLLVQNEVTEAAVLASVSVDEVPLATFDTARNQPLTGK